MPPLQGITPQKVGVSQVQAAQRKSRILELTHLKLKFKPDTKAIAHGGAAGLLVPAAAKVSPTYATEISMGVVGAMTGNATLQTLAGFSFGTKILAGGLLGGESSSDGGWL